MKNISYIYFKNNKIRVLTEVDSVFQHNQLTKEGWIHTTTLNTNVFIEHLYNECSDEEIIDNINALSDLTEQK